MMKDVNIVIYSENRKILKKVDYAIIRQSKVSKFFNVNTKQISKIENLKNPIDFLVILSSKKQNNSQIIKQLKELKIRQIAVVNFEKGFIKMNDKIEKIQNMKDIMVIGFFLVYNYYCNVVKKAK